MAKENEDEESEDKKDRLPLQVGMDGLQEVE